MERLTYRSDDGSCCFLHCMHCEGDNCKCCNEVDNAADRLAAYEDTGLTPEDLQGHGDIDFLRVIELLKADAEGRLVVLPCKAGDLLYYFPAWYAKSGYEPEPVSVDEVNSFSGSIVVECYMDPDTRLPITPADFGETVFLTREEADAAHVADKNFGHKKEDA